MSIEPGGHASRPLEVRSAATVEFCAVALGCAVCGGALRGLFHDALTADGVFFWVQINAPLAN